MNRRPYVPIHSNSGVLRIKLLAASLIFVSLVSTAQSTNVTIESFTWPHGNIAALSLSFDDARLSQMDIGLPLFDQLGALVTFYVLPSAVEERIELWKQAMRQGHEIGNHSLNHPCTGNFLWAREHALEEYTLEKMRNELLSANETLKAQLGVTPRSFAYPCGQTFVGRGKGTQSYVPVAAELFQSARGWLGEAPNDPAYCDMYQVTGMSMDNIDFEEVMLLLEQAKEQGSWLILAGHEIGDEGHQTTRSAMLKELISYAQDPANKIWMAPVGTIAEYVVQNRQ